MKKPNSRIEKTIKMACLGCGKILRIKNDSYEARGIFNVFCPGGECEDRYASRL